MENIKKSGVGIKDADAVVRVQGEFANLTRDCGFKIVLGTEGQSERLLMTLLNRILPDAGIVELQYLPSEHFGTGEDDGKSIFDVYCKDRTGTRFLIEMQIWAQHYFHKRAVYYAARSIMDQARIERKYQKEVLKRRWDYNFAPVYVVCFLNFPSDIVGSSGADAERHTSQYVFRSIENGRLLGDNVNLVFIDLYRFRKEFAECRDMKERWLYSLKNMHLLKEQPVGVAGTELEELYREAYMDLWSAGKKDKYNKLMTREDEIMNSMREQSEDAYNKGKEEGREEGREEGLIMVARKLKAQGVSIEDIIGLTGLSVEICEAL